MPALIYAPGSLTAYQVRLPTGQIVGGLGDTTGVRLLGVQGLRDLAPLRSSDPDRGMQHGAFPGVDYMGERQVTFKWQLTCAPSGIEAALAYLSNALQVVSDPSSTVLTVGDFLRQQANVGATLPISTMQVQLPGRTYPLLLLGRPSKHVVPVDLNYQYGRVEPQTVWTVPDGAVYDAVLVSGQCGLPTPGTGHAWGGAFPWTWGASSGGGIQLNNTGLYQAKPYFKITGPVSYPKILNSGTGEQIKLNIVLGRSDVLGVDTQNGNILLNGAARNNILLPGSVFFSCAPGQTTINFTSSDATAVTGQLYAYMLPTYSLA